MNHAQEGFSMKNNVLVFSLILLSFCLSAQNISIGKWRAHTARNQVNAIVKVDNQIFCGTKGGLFYYFTDDNETGIISKSEGIDDLEITSLAYENSTQSLVVGYLSGNIIIKQKENIFTISYITDAQNITGSKKINHIGIYKNNAIFSCDFGVVIYDLKKLEIKETWLNIGAGGSRIKINKSLIVGDSIFLATDNGIYKSSFVPSLNLMDFRNWKKEIVNDSLKNRNITFIAERNGKLVAAYNGIGVFTKTSNWELKFYTTRTINAFSADNANIYATYNDGFLIYNETNSREIFNRYFTTPKDLLVENENFIWFADSQKGLVKFENNNYKYIYPNAPHSNQVFSLNTFNNYVISFKGAYDAVSTPRFNNSIYSYFENGVWNDDSTLYKKGLIDIVSISNNPQKGEFIYASAWNGLIQRRDTTIKIYNNSTSECMLYDNFGTRVTSTFYDEKTGETWFGNIAGISGSVKSVYKLKKDNTCEGYFFSFQEAWYPVQILVDNYNNKWVRLNQRQGGGLLVFNENYNQPQNLVYKFFKKGTGLGNLTDVVVRSMAKDRNGDIWCGTDNGVSVFYSTSYVLQPNVNVDASFPIFENRPLLFEQPVLSMAIDGGNRKWLGTNKGLYLVSPDGTRILQYFSKDNSPMIDDQVTSLVMLPSTGELFIGSPSGIVSYQTNSSIGNDETATVKIYPNPVKSNFDGLIGFSGLATDAVVKVTDITGRLVYETKANGGTASWNGKDYNGKSIEPGVYVVLTSKDDGNGAVAGKIFITD